MAWRSHLRDLAMLNLTFEKKSIATLSDPDPATIQLAIENHLGVHLANPITALSLDDAQGWAILQWDPTCKNYRQIGSLRPEGDGL